MGLYRAQNSPEDPQRQPPRYSGTGDFFSIFAIGTASIHGAAPHMVLLYPLPGRSVKNTLTLRENSLEYYYL